MVSLVVFAAGVLIGLYGLVLILYRGEDASGNTYVKLGGSDIDAQSVGVSALMLALVALAVAFLLLRSRFANRNAKHS
jgi:hypothetical protein